MSIFAKYAGLREGYDSLKSMGANPFGVKFDAVLSPTEGVLNGKRTILLGTTTTWA